MKSSAIKGIVTDKLSNNKKARGEKAMRGKAKRINDPLWSSVVLMIEEYVTSRMLLLPGKWYEYSEDAGFFCQLSI